MIPFTISVAAMGCVTGPLNGQDIGDYDDSIAFVGYIFGQGDKACVYATDEPTGDFYYVADDTASSSGTSKWSVTGYAFSVSDDIPGSSWKCNLPLDGTARSWVRIQESDYGGCLGRLSASQDDVDYTYDIGSNLSGCLSGNSSWSEFWDDCPVSDDAPVIEVNADRAGDPRTTAGCTPLTAALCDDDNPCTTDTVNANKNACIYTDVTDGTSCGGTHTCESGVCLPPLCDIPNDPDLPCGAGEYYEQLYAGIDGDAAGSCTAHYNWRRCFTGCGPGVNISAGDETQEDCETDYNGDPNDNEFLPAQGPGIMCDSNDDRIDCRPRIDLE